MRLLIAPIALVPLALAACATVAPVTTVGPSAAARPACADTVFPHNPRIADWSVGKFTGDYRGGAAVVQVRLVANRLLVTRPGGSPREVRGTTLDDWTMRDGCGVQYHFMLPPDGPGARLEISDAAGKTVWNRLP